MAHASFHSLPVRTTRCLKRQRSALLQDSNSLQLILVLVIMSIGLVGVFAPEKPDHFASICQKHNSTNVCRVW